MTSSQAQDQSQQSPVTTTSPEDAADGALAMPLGMRYLVSPPVTHSETRPVVYSEDLQLNISAAGNPWHTQTAHMAETHTETNPDGNGPGSDSGTDLY